MARDAGIGIALHQAGTPVMAMPNAQCAMAIDNFIALEMHSVDSPWWNDLVTIAGQDGPMIQNGYVNVPDAPGLGIELNEEAILEHQNRTSPRYAAKPQEVWGSTSEWTEVDSHDRTWS
jgi:L-alanine-DL-glutamate epimerase-like enolase superfamily enzyme